MNEVSIQDVTSPASGASDVGPQYVTGTPARKPILRPLRQPLYDSEIYVAATPNTSYDLFVNRRTFAATGAAKNAAATNMPSDGGFLANPLEFDLVGFNGHFNYNALLDDQQRMYNGGVFAWVFGTTTTWLSIKLNAIPAGTGLVGGVAIPAAAIVVSAAVANGVPSPNVFFNFSDHRKQARRIVSNESFRNNVQFLGVAALVANVTWTTYMIGILYASL
jgi:hypothetical protein